MNDVRSGNYYTKEHEWVNLEENVITLGLTDYAQNSLGDIVFVDLPELDAEVQKDESFGVIESVKAVSDLYSPISGKIVEINETLKNSPEIINDDPYDEGWLVKIEVEATTEEIETYLEENLMDVEAYKKFLEEED